MKRLLKDKRGEGFGWITDEGGGTVQENVHSDGDINKQVGNMG